MAIKCNYNENLIFCGRTYLKWFYAIGKIKVKVWGKQSGRKPFNGLGLYGVPNNVLSFECLVRMIKWERAGWSTMVNKNIQNIY